MCSGGLIRSHSGSWITRFSCFEGYGNCLLAKLLAVKRGLKQAWEGGFRRVFLETDSQDVVSALLHKNHDHLHMHASVVKEIVELMNLNWNVKINHIFREANVVADKLAKMG